VWSGASLGWVGGKNGKLLAFFVDMVLFSVGTYPIIHRDVLIIFGSFISLVMNQEGPSLMINGFDLTFDPGTAKTMRLR
jgi:hypothetical protein